MGLGAPMWAVFIVKSAVMYFMDELVGCAAKVSIVNGLGFSFELWVCSAVAKDVVYTAIHFVPLFLIFCLSR